MIRPFTIVTFLMATGSGLYLYQSKHAAQVLDRSIEHTVHETAQIREQSRLLAAEWTMLNDPERLRQFSDTYLSLKTISPAQFTSLVDLDSRLPAPRIEAPKVEQPLASDDEERPVAAEPDASPASGQAVLAGGEEDLPLPPRPAARPVHRVVAFRSAIPASGPVNVTVAETRPAKPAETRVADLRPVELHPATLPMPVRSPPPTPAPMRTAAAAPPPAPVVALAPAPQPMRTAAAAPAPHYLPNVPPQAASSLPWTGGSLLGMAHGGVPALPSPQPGGVSAVPASLSGGVPASPLPRPTPVSSNNW